MYALKHQFLSFALSPPHSPLLLPSSRNQGPSRDNTPEFKARSPRTSSPPVSASSRTTIPTMQCGHPTSFHTDKEEKRFPGAMERSLLAYSSELREPFRTCLVRAITSAPQVFTFSVRSPFTDRTESRLRIGVPSPSLRPVNTSQRHASRPGQKDVQKRKERRRCLFSYRGKRCDACA